MLTETRIRLYQALRAVIDGMWPKAIAGRRDERGAIPAEVAWIAGLVVLAIVVLGIIALVTTHKASTISLN